MGTVPAYATPDTRRAGYCGIYHGKHGSVSAALCALGEEAVEVILTYRQCEPVRACSVPGNARSAT
jgi:hypothetical protein